MQSTHEVTIQGRFTGQPATGAGRYQILFILAGVANGWTFSREVLEESANLWERSSVFIDHSFWGSSVRDLGGVLTNAAWSEEFQGLTAELVPAGPSKEIVLEAARMMLDELSAAKPNVGFSADVIFTADATRTVKKIIKPMSVDLVMDPAFATKFIRQLSQRASCPPGEIPRHEGAGLHSGKELPLKIEQQDQAKADEALHQIGEMLLAGSLQNSGLPAKVQAAVKASFANRPIILEDVQNTIQAWKDAQAELEAPSTIQGPARVSSMFSSDDQLTAAVDDLVGAPREKGAENLAVARFTGLKEAYIAMTGDRDMVGGYFKDRIQFQHTTDSFPGLVKNALNKALVREWEQLGRAGYDWWQKIVRVEHFESLQDITWLLFGTVASLPTVLEGADYTELKLGDGAETSSFVKKGGYIGLTLEAIDRDDGRKLKAIPRELALAGLREISALVAAIFTDNTATGPVMADTGALFNNTAVTTKGGHANLLTTAIGADFTAWDAIAQAMYNQPMLVANETGYYGTGKKMAIEPRYCLVPRALKAAAEALFIPRWASTNGAQVVPTVGGHTYAGAVEPIVVPEWTDANDYAAVADPAIVPGIMIGERFGLVPQIFLAGSETDPAMFANDEQRIKVRHFIAVGVADFRGLHKENV
jgi:hypothetical protein